MNAYEKIVLAGIIELVSKQAREAGFAPSLDNTYNEVVARLNDHEVRVQIQKRIDGSGYNLRVQNTWVIPLPSFANVDHGHDWEDYLHGVLLEIRADIS